MNLDPEKDDPLRRTLREWTVDSSLPPRFREGVWHRITRAEALRHSGAWAELMRRLESLLARPALAAAYLAVLLAAGAASGYWTAQTRAGDTETAWRAQYVQAVDPYQTPR